MNTYKSRANLIENDQVAEIPVRFLLGIKKTEDGKIDENDEKYIVMSENVTKTGLEDLKKEHPNYFIRPVRLPEDEIPTQELIEKMVSLIEDAIKQTSPHMKKIKKESAENDIKENNEKLINKSKHKINI
jgi:hypothetical protein